MTDPKQREEIQKDNTAESSGGRFRKWVLAILSAACMVAVFLLSGCTLQDVLRPVKDFFGKEASVEEETASLSVEDTLLYAQVNDSQGRVMVKANGEPLTVLAAIETATGGEPRINSEGILETYPLGEPVTYTPGSPVIGADGEYETYAGGEKIINVLGFALNDGNGNIQTRPAGEIVTHGADEVVTDENGERVRYNGEPRTYAPGEIKYDTAGEQVTYPVVIQTDQEGETVTNEAGEIQIGSIELVTNSAGDPFVDDNGEAATRLLDPVPPKLIVQPPFESGLYFINNITSKYVFFSTPEVMAEQIAIVTDADYTPEQFMYESGEGPVHNLQLEMLGRDLSGLDVVFDLEGYASFAVKGTDQVLTLAGPLRNGVNILVKPAEKTSYPQYKYWDDPLYTLADNQKWIIKEDGAGNYLICSALDENFVMTVDDQYGIQYANIMLWEYDGSDQQRFTFTTEQPRVENKLKEGNYYIRSGLSDWMLFSFGDGNFADGSSLYLNTSDKGDGQWMTVRYDEYGLATISHANSSKVLTVGYGEAVNGQSVVQYESDGGNWQKWILDPDPENDGGYYIRSALNVSEVIDLTDGDTRREKPIQMHWNNNTYAQYWFFEEEAIASPYEYATMDEYAQNFSSMTDYLILASSDTNHVGVYTGSKGNWTNLFYWDCVTGKGSTPTVKGEYTIFSKSPSFDGNMDSPAWYTCYYASWWYPEYAFHSIIYYQGTMNIMDASMGYNASHGCVRLYTDNAQWIYDNVPLNTKVVSY